MRILFVEDELEKNIPRLLRLFGKFLSKNQKDELKALENDEYGATPEQIKTIMERKDLFRIEYRFPDALKEIVTNANKYALFIIDRNLSLTEYDFAEVRTIDQKFSEAQYDKFFEREGDYFLHKLIYQKISVAMCFYFLTAYSFDSEIKGAEDLKNHIEFNQFGRENFIEKANSNDITRLQNIIENQQTFLIRHENVKYLEILKQRIDENVSDSFWYILVNRNNKDYVQTNLGAIRVLLENIMRVTAQKLNAPDDCWDNVRNIKARSVINWLVQYNSETRTNHYQFDTNSIIKDFCYNIYEISSDFGAHHPPPGFQPTTDTVNALIFALKDLIVWFDGVLEKFGEN
ncbi:MAG: hypothetical protein ACP5FZ_07750 [Fidelibacterota bacterium]